MIGVQLRALEHNIKSLGTTKKSLKSLQSKTLKTIDDSKEAVTALTKAISSRKNAQAEALARVKA